MAEMKLVPASVLSPFNLIAEIDRKMADGESTMVNITAIRALVEAALAPREEAPGDHIVGVNQMVCEEAPAEGAGEPWALLVEAEQHLRAMVSGQPHARAAEKTADAILRSLARARTSEPVGTISQAIKAKYDKVKATTYRPGTPAEGMKDGVLHGLNTALAIAMIAEDRTSEPEAGAAVGAVSGTCRADLYTADLPVGTKLYTHPSPATADKLRVAVEAALNADAEARERLKAIGCPLNATPEMDALAQALATLSPKEEGGV